jgi:hypothetical protein
LKLVKKQLSAGYRCVYDWTAGRLTGNRTTAYNDKSGAIILPLYQEGRMGPSVAVMDSLTFTFDAQEAIAMADPKETKRGAGP